MAEEIRLSKSFIETELPQASSLICVGLSDDISHWAGCEEGG